MTDSPDWYIDPQRAGALFVSSGDRALRAAAAKCARGEKWRGVRLRSRWVAGHGGRDGKLHLEIGVAELALALPEHAEALRAAMSAPTPALASGRRLPGAITKRADWGGERLLFLRRLAKAAGLGSLASTAIAASLDQETRRQWAGPAGRVGWRRVAEWASGYLYDLAIAHGADLPEAELRVLCRVPRSYVIRWERRVHRKTDTWLNDRQDFANREPGVRRHRAEWPLDMVYGDGTALDIRILRPDGSEWKVEIILWLDGATNRLWGHCYARPKGGAATQQHVAWSLISLASAEGMLRAVYIDRGSPYAKVKLLETTGLARVIRALPYGARGKAIESIIRLLVHQYISQIEGYLGSDRFAKPTQTVGRPTKPFSGTMQALFGAVAEAIDLYNSMPQECLGGRSPDDLWQAEIDRGWRPARIAPETLVEALVKIETRKVRQGFVKIDGVEFSCDALCRAWALEDEKVTVHVPLIPDMPPSVYAPDGRFVGLVYPREWQDNDRAGAREAARLKALRRQGARELEQAAPPADVRPHQQAWLERHAPPDEAPPGELVELPGERGKAAAARRALPPPAPEEAEGRLEQQMRLLREFGAQARAVK